METFNFNKAFELINKGFRVKRASWDGLIFIKRPTERSEINLPFIAFKTKDHDIISWEPTQSDLFAEDWILIID